MKVVLVEEIKRHANNIMVVSGGTTSSPTHTVITFLERAKMKKFNMRLDQLEVRSCNNHLTSEGEHSTCEIVKWNDDNKTCYTLASWNKHKEGYDLQFVGYRPFDLCEYSDFWKLAKAGQNYLEELPI